MAGGRRGNGPIIIAMLMKDTCKRPRVKRVCHENPTPFLPECADLIQSQQYRKLYLVPEDESLNGSHAGKHRAEYGASRPKFVTFEKAVTRLSYLLWMVGAILFPAREGSFRGGKRPFHECVGDFAEVYGRFPTARNSFGDAAAVSRLRGSIATM